MSNKLSDELSQAVAELEREKVLSLVKERLDTGVKPMEVVKKMQEGMTHVGNLFESGEYFISELINAGEIMKEAMSYLEPHLMGEEEEHRGNVVIATVKGDIHDLGKNIVIMLLKGTGYNVIDLGVDVPAQKVVDAVKEYNTPLLGLSVLLTSCLDSMKETVKAVKDAGVDTQVIIGGPIINESAIEYCGADYGSTSAGDAVKVAEKVIG